MKFSLRSARSHDRSGEYGPAIANYMGILKLIPANRGTLESEFLTCFQKFARQLETSRRTEELNEYFTLISDLYPSSPRFLTMWGEFLARQGLHEEAALCFMKSLDFQPDYGDAKRSLRNLRYGLIDQWHFRMLNDRQRNAAYEQALSVCLARSHLPSPVHVLDIGSGTGILSMLALEVGAQKVVACESSPIMCQMAKKILAENGFGRSGDVVLIEKHSKDVKLLEDLNGDRVHVIVTEIMDAGFFGEGIVGTLLDAKRRLLDPSSGLIIPSRATVWACAIECESIRRSHSVAVIDGHGDRIVSTLCTGSASSASSSTRQEPYTSAMLSKIKGGYRYLTQPFVIDRIDLNDEEDLARHQIGLSTIVTATITESGLVDAIACWFEVDLLPASISKTNISICTKPGTTDSAWEQAIFPVAESKKQLGETIDVEVVIQDDWLQLSIRLQDDQRPTIAISDTTLIEAINDDRLIDFYHDTSSGTVLDLSGNPRLTLQAASSHRQMIAVQPNPDAVSITKSLQRSIDNQPILISSIDSLEMDIDAILFSPIEACGLLKQNALEDLAFCRLRFDITRIVPSSIDIWGVLVESEELERYARVISDQNTLGLKIKNILNVFETDIQRDLELSTLSHKRLSEPVKLMRLDFGEPLTNSDDGSLPKLLAQTTNISLETTVEGTCHALVFWYELSNGDLKLSTADPRTHFRVAAAMTSPFLVSQGDLIRVQSTLERSELYFSVSMFDLADL